jgi:hypothetical protein
VYAPGVDVPRLNNTCCALITSPAGAENVPACRSLLLSVFVVPVAQNVPPLYLLLSVVNLSLLYSCCSGTWCCSIAIAYVYVFGVDAARSITPVAALITSPAGAENVPPVAPVVVSVVVPVAQNVPPLTVAVGCELIVTVLVAVPVHGAVP